MRVSVVTFPGSNCDADAVHVIRNLLGATTDMVWHADHALPADTGLVVLPGGFSYGDALRSGAIAQFSPIMNAVQAHADRGGLVLGICNGFQILVETGLLPGAMLQNASQKFVCRMVELEVEGVKSPFMGGYEAGRRLRIPVAHHEGRYYIDGPTRATLEGQGRVAFRYTEATDPNGSTGRIAGVMAREGRVLGMMPHPERAAERWLGSTDGHALFASALDWCRATRSGS